MSASLDPLWRVAPDGSRYFEASSTTQQEFLDSTAREILFSGMYGSGKSIAMCLKAWKLCEYYPGIKGVVLRRHYEDLKASTLKLFPKLFGPEMWNRGVQGGPKEPDGFLFDNGSSIDFFGVSGDSRRTEKLKSTDYGFGMADEVDELTEEEWEMLLGRLRQNTVPVRQAFAGCNPNSPTHWLYSRFNIAQGSNQQWRMVPCPRCLKRGGGAILIDAGCRTCHGAGEVNKLIRELFMSGSTDNDRNHPAEYIDWRRNLTGRRALRYRDGKWVMYEGSVFEQWDPNIHLIDATKSALTTTWAQWDGLPPPDWRRVRGIDFGFDNPFVCQWWAINPEGRWFRYREIYKSQTTLGVHAERIKALEADEMTRLRRAAERMKRYADYRTILDGDFPIELAPADHDRSDRETLSEAGIWTSPAKKDIGAGIDMLLDMMNPEQTGGPRLFLIRGALVEKDQRLAFDKKPTCTEDEIPGLRWAKGVSGELAGRRKDLPVDLDNHGTDAMRYSVFSGTGGKKAAIY